MAVQVKLCESRVGEKKPLEDHERKHGNGAVQTAQDRDRAKPKQRQTQQRGKLQSDKG